MGRVSRSHYKNMGQMGNIVVSISEKYSLPQVFSRQLKKDMSQVGVNDHLCQMLLLDC